MGKARKKTSFVPRFVFGTGVGIGVVPLCAALAPASCSEAQGPVIYPYVADASADADGDANVDAKFTLGSSDAETEADVVDDGPLGPIIYPSPP
jgi:hypothetical protein